ncbi:MAG TPA: hypothetical protein VMP08_15560, partial [Anaerolineae bacterium]|nr:hypothetical protein [Anaerolineae bacterium]
MAIRFQTHSKPLRISCSAASQNPIDLWLRKNLPENLSPGKDSQFQGMKFVIKSSLGIDKLKI